MKINLVQNNSFKSTYIYKELDNLGKPHYSVRINSDHLGQKDRDKKLYFDDLNNGSPRIVVLAEDDHLYSLDYPLLNHNITTVGEFTRYLKKDNIDPLIKFLKEGKFTLILEPSVYLHGLSPNGIFRKEDKEMIIKGLEQKAELLKKEENNNEPFINPKCHIDYIAGSIPELNFNLDVQG